MRRVALGTLLAGIGLAAVSAATALSTRAPEEFNQTLTLAGGPGASAAAPVDDPDAPIATARYGGERSHAVSAEIAATPVAATVALVGGPGDAGLVGGPVGAVASQNVNSQNATAQNASSLNAAAEPARIAPARPTARGLAEGPVASPRPVLALTKTAPQRAYGKVLQARVDDQPLAFTPPGLRSSAVKRLTLNASSLMSKATASAEDLRRGRWMLFAASSGKALGLSLVRDTFGGWRNAGFSEETLARFGSRQVGVGYRKGASLISLTATRRKFNRLDYTDKDTVVGMTVSVRAR